MRYCLVTSLCILSFPLLAETASAEDARAILDRAIQAHGGAARLERTKRGHLKMKCEVTQSSGPLAYEIEEWFDLPVRNKRLYDRHNNGTNIHVEWLFLGKESWMREGTRPVDHVSSLVSYSAEDKQWYAFLAMFLLLRKEEVPLTALPEETKNGITLTGIHAVYSQCLWDYFFDKTTGLLKRSKGTPPAQGASSEVQYDDYRDIQGIHYPMRFKVAGPTSSSTITLSSIEFLDKIDESVFIKPQTAATERKTEETVVRKTSSQPSTTSSDKSPENRNNVLIIVTAIAGVIVGAVWFIVRASRRDKPETPPS